ncbi:hypothetical protein CBR_g3986 [Chara braunii]|uniref:Uncharacterized protein n=1 Tax=Chara braunii TaxID=69332 RepID=A0A388KH15_CHABU|nr:hypothetical protein CBR_g3986 [Chara braunii]|eukprot:GBG69287.1 hypothetical protein CBR_g3986 [Chara braunii]
MGGNGRAHSWRIGGAFLGSKHGHDGNDTRLDHATRAASYSLESVPRVVAYGYPRCSGGHPVLWSNIPETTRSAADVLPFHLLENELKSRAVASRSDCRPFIKLFMLTAVAIAASFLIYETLSLGRVGRFIRTHVEDDNLHDHDSQPSPWQAANGDVMLQPAAARQRVETRDTFLFEVVRWNPEVSSSNGDRTNRLNHGGRGYGRETIRQHAREWDRKGAQGPSPLITDDNSKMQTETDNRSQPLVSKDSGSTMAKPVSAIRLQNPGMNGISDDEENQDALSYTSLVPAAIEVENGRAGWQRKVLWQQGQTVPKSTRKSRERELQGQVRDPAFLQYRLEYSGVQDGHRIWRRTGIPSRTRRICMRVSSILAGWFAAGSAEALSCHTERS